MSVTAHFEWAVGENISQAVMQSFHREIKLGLKSQYLEVITYGRRFCLIFLFFKENYIFLWTSLLSGAKVGDLNIEGMPKSLVSYLTQVIKE